MPREYVTTLVFASLSLVLSVAASTRAEDTASLTLQFLGDQGHHQPARRAAELLPILSENGINVQYS